MSDTDPDTLPMIPVAKPRFTARPFPVGVPNRPVKIVKSPSGAGYHAVLAGGTSVNDVDTLPSMQAAKPVIQTTKSCNSPACRGNSYDSDEHNCWSCGCALIVKVVA